MCQSCVHFTGEPSKPWSRNRLLLRIIWTFTKAVTRNSHLRKPPTWHQPVPPNTGMLAETAIVASPNWNKCNRSKSNERTNMPSTVKKGQKNVKLVLTHSPAGGVWRINNEEQPVQTAKRSGAAPFEGVGPVQYAWLKPWNERRPFCCVGSTKIAFVKPANRTIYSTHSQARSKHPPKSDPDPNPCSSWVK